MPEWWQGKTPNGITPHLWLSPEAAAFLDSIDQPDWNVLEHGAGGSTLWFAKRCDWVMSIETNQEWYERLMSMKEKYQNMSIILADRSLLHTLPVLLCGRFDFLMIDGEPLEHRNEFANRASFLVKPGGWVCFDNCNREEFKEAREHLRSISDEVVTFDGNTTSPVRTQYLVTEFYRLKT